MKQILQSLRTGETEVAEVPAPTVKPGRVLIRSSRTLVSAGTERMLIEFGKAGWLAKARQQPDKVRMVLDKVRSDGLMPTLEAVRNKLDRPLPLGYCNVGRVVEVGAGVEGLSLGVRIASNGCHAELVSVPANLCAKVPDQVSDDEAAFTVIGAVALQGARLAGPSLGETVVVTGLGLIGLITVQLLRAHGCRVLAIDYDSSKVDLARGFGAVGVDLSKGEEPLSAAGRLSRGRGVDAVIIAATTESNEPIRQAAEMCRKRGRIVLVGVSGLELSRADFYEKELTFQVSCSYGPGRYDPVYEEKGIDYPVAFVRWTAQRNFEAVLDLMATGQLDVRPLISHRFNIDEAVNAYELVGGSEPSLGIVLQYRDVSEALSSGLRSSTLELSSQATSVIGPAVDRRPEGVAFIGAGNYANAVLIPAFKEAGAVLETIVSGGGVSGTHAGRKFGFRRTSTDADSVFTDSQIGTVVIATRHDSHADLVSKALASGKHVFVEKPLALTQDELKAIGRVYAASLEAGDDLRLMVGFNRRFAPQVEKIKALLAGVTGPKTFVMTVNAGAIPPGHWTQDPSVGGGRILGEACHFVDLLRFLADGPIEGHSAVSIGRAPGLAVTDDKATITLRFEDGSMGIILYLANGHKSFPKERLEVFADGRILQLDNYRRLRGFGWPGFKWMNLWRQDKGQKRCVAAFLKAVEDRAPPPIPFDELMEVSRVSIAIAEGLR